MEFCRLVYQYMFYLWPFTFDLCADRGSQESDDIISKLLAEAMDSVDSTGTQSYAEYSR